jgi:hypothetical protein
MQWSVIRALIELSAAFGALGTFRNCGNLPSILKTLCLMDDVARMGLIVAAALMIDAIRDLVRLLWQLL